MYHIRQSKFLLHFVVWPRMPLHKNYLMYISYLFYGVILWNTLYLSHLLLVITRYLLHLLLFLISHHLLSVISVYNKPSHAIYYIYLLQYSEFPQWLLQRTQHWVTLYFSADK